MDASTKGQTRDTSTVKGLIDQYIESYAKPKKMSWHEDLRMLNKNVLPKWKYLPTADITKKDVVKLLDRIGASGGVANKTLKVLQSMFAFAVSESILEANPCSDMKIDDAPKERIFKADEIRKIWFGLENAKMPGAMRSILKFLLVTGQRNGEVAGAKWEEFNLREKWWTIPGTRTKNKKSHQVFLTPMAIAILGQTKKHGWVFPSGKDKHIAPRAVSLAIRNNSENKSLSKQNSAYGDFFRVGQFVPNDLRRTVAFQMADAGVDEIKVTKVMNQATSTNTHDAEIRQAMETWEQKLKAILVGWKRP
ncbi:MAG: tyrosine-type recombinase/integrase [Nitrospinae bacterium]|nr:tyrosine-type recombinase/integrase [Nitrospinota bacterium]MBL7021450.1 tyrosine-type recombinase/integrase [Nitrospinaceae bacterium]